MRILDSAKMLIASAGIFTGPLLALAFATFALAAWAGLRVRDVSAPGMQSPRVIRDVMRGLRLLGASASAAPMVGLLGTVRGLIVLFSGLEESGTFDREVLTRGVGQALFTTEFGLAIAVPGIVLHAIILRSLRTRAGALEVVTAPRRRRARR